jgi:hypothetical protein
MCSVERPCKSITGQERRVCCMPRISGRDVGTVMAMRTGGFEFSVTSAIGDSGRAYLLRFEGREFVIGTHFANFVPRPPLPKEPSNFRLEVQRQPKWSRLLRNDPTPM